MGGFFLLWTALKAFGIDSSRETMRKYAYRQAMLNLAFYGLVACMTTHPSVLIGHIALHLIAFLVLAGLLLFIVGRSEDICRIRAACFKILPAGFFPLNPDPIFTHRRDEKIAFRKSPNPPPRFQRPPPTSLFNFCS